MSIWGGEGKREIFNISSDQIALKKGKEICDSFGFVQIKGNIFSGCFAGVVLSGINEKPSMELLKKADQALYCAESENRGGCCLQKMGEGNDDSTGIV